MAGENAPRLKMTVQLDSQTLDALEQIAMEVRRAVRAGTLPRRGRGRPFGSATVASTIIQRVVRDHPGLLREFFENEITVAPKETAIPKSQTARQRSHQAGS